MPPWSGSAFKSNSKTRHSSTLAFLMAMPKAVSPSQSRCLPEKRKSRIIHWTPFVWSSWAAACKGESNTSPARRRSNAPARGHQITGTVPSAADRVGPRWPFQSRSANVNVPFHDTSEQHFIRHVHFFIILVIIFLLFDTPVLSH
jgi:hypothetical protein